MITPIRGKTSTFIYIRGYLPLARLRSGEILFTIFHFKRRYFATHWVANLWRVQEKRLTNLLPFLMAKVLNSLNLRGISPPSRDYEVT